MVSAFLLCDYYYYYHHYHHYTYFFHVNLGELNTATTTKYAAATWNPYIDFRQGVGLGRFDVLFNEMTTYRWRRRSAYSTTSGQLLNHHPKVIERDELDMVKDYCVRTRGLEKRRESSALS